jgi:hypothetical protein
MTDCRLANRSTNLPGTVHSALKQSQRIRTLLIDSLGDIECHADDWVLPTVNSTPTSWPGLASHPDQQFACRFPSPLIHSMSEDPEGLLSSGAKNCGSVGNLDGRLSYRPIPRRAQHHRRVNSDIIRKLVGSNIELAQASDISIRPG